MGVSAVAEGEKPVDEMRTPLFEGRVGREAGWVVFVDDDTYVLPEALSELLQWYDPSERVAIGRLIAGWPKEQAPGSSSSTEQLLIGGGAGIVLSRAALAAVHKAVQLNRCSINRKDLKWVHWPFRGGDAWLGGCMVAAGVAMVSEAGFEPLPPLAMSATEAMRAASFHRMPLLEMVAQRE
eukprot:3141603-Pleurochrysis_carterae.AAC.1